MIINRQVRSWTMVRMSFRTSMFFNPFK